MIRQYGEVVGWILGAVLLAALYRQSGRHDAERRAWLAERQAFVQLVDSTLEVTGSRLTEAATRETRLAATVDRLAGQVAGLRRNTDSVKAATAQALTAVASLAADASIEDSLAAFQIENAGLQAVVEAQMVELEGVPGDTVRIGLRETVARQLAAFVDLQRSHEGLRSDVAVLRADLQKATDLLNRAPITRPCRVPVLGVSCETVLVVGIVVAANR